MALGLLAVESSVRPSRSEGEAAVDDAPECGWRKCEALAKRAWAAAPKLRVTLEKLLVSEEGADARWACEPCEEEGCATRSRRRARSSYERVWE